MSKFYITTPIYYINDKPHIGHAYSTIAADVLARYRRHLGDEVYFSAGTDENGQKTIEAAEKAGKPVREYADLMVQQWEATWSQLAISHDRFIRTTEEAHTTAVYDFMKRVKPEDLYKSSYEGLYCVGCEEFKKAADLTEGKCPLHNRVPEKRKEDNYFFKLSVYQKPLLDYIHEHPEFVQPATRRNEVVSFIERGLEDISVSRIKDPDNAWGIDWPGDDTQVLYVWFDALVNYLTAISYPKDYEQWWPADIHLVGKDIIKFHCMIWPAMLMSAGLPLPKMVYAHGFFTINGLKISKSLGNAIDPVALAAEYGVDALRYYLMREIPFGQDGDFNLDRFKSVYETELANELGNLVQRVAVMITKYQGGAVGEVPPHTHDVSAYKEAMQHLRLDRALEAVWDEVRGVNQYIEQEKPWKLAKGDQEQLSDVLAHAVSDLTQIANMIMPFMPAAAQKIAQTFEGGTVHPEVGILFPKFREDPEQDPSVVMEQSA